MTNVMTLFVFIMKIAFWTVCPYRKSIICLPN